MQNASLDRRDFLHATAAGALAVGSAAVIPRRGFAADPAGTPSADKFISGKDSRLIVHNAKVGEIETPLELLSQHAVTPKQLLFVRNNQVLPGVLTTAPFTEGDWRIELLGQLDHPQSVSTSFLAKLPQKEVELVLQCSGNGRAFFARAAKADGVQWRHGAMGNVVFGGVPLAALLDKLGAKPAAEAKFLAAEGADQPLMEGAADFEHSLPLADVLERSLIALTMNGEPIPRVHGGPARLVTPGFYGTMHVKWVYRLRFEDRESNNHHHASRYRTPLKPIPPGTKFTSTLDNSEPNWGMKIKSVVFSPQPGERLFAGPTAIRGVAWNDGAARIDAVEVSIDAGQTWRKAELKRPGSPYAWHPWTITVDLPAGKHTILSRATDALGRTQPFDGGIHWNPAGYAWNGVDQIEVTVA